MNLKNDILHANHSLNECCHHNDKNKTKLSYDIQFLIVKIRDFLIVKGAGICSLYHEIHYIEIRYIEVWVYLVKDIGG